MAQPSKKDHIAASALPLFFEHGIKGTSVDMVVKISKVSKPTVYNHFPDKGALFLHVIQTWLNSQPTAGISPPSDMTLLDHLEQTWLNDEALKLYALIIGEGYRAPEAAQLFKLQYDAVWRNCAEHWADNNGELKAELLEKVSHHLLAKLMA
ncbi:TetR/AcrR family transcriptional regulator [Reinekea sp.]|jgi:TetR/AcrR family transcriptional regulator of autoinduction and epiphytic fitness|uniref:TetR/AcrR family transcriptional regulator n=1 Tax=Reinekea sp. TaxID=1970455 RepID=UPI00398A443F